MNASAASCSGRISTSLSPAATAIGTARRDPCSPRPGRRRRPASRYQERRRPFSAPLGRHLPSSTQSSIPRPRDETSRARPRTRRRASVTKIGSRLAATTIDSALIAGSDTPMPPVRRTRPHRDAISRHPPSTRCACPKHRGPRAPPVAGPQRLKRSSITL